MAFFFKRKNIDPAPEWTSFANLSEFEEFTGLVRKYFEKKQLAYTIQDDCVTVEDKSWPMSHMGLANLAQICNQSPRSEWKSIITNHYDGMIKGKQFESAFHERANDYTYAAPFLGVRIYPADYLSHVGPEATIKTSVADDLIAILVFDFPHGVVNVKPQTTIQWNRTNEQLYETGLANIRHNYKSDLVTEEINGYKIWFLHGDHFFVSNTVLDLHLQSVPIGGNGALVGIPHRHAVLVYPIEDMSVVQVLQSFIFVLQGMYQEGPGSISNSLYWYRDGKLMKLPYELRDNELSFTPTDEFLELMNQLPPPKK